MKSFPKILTIFFLAAFIIQLFCLLFLLALPLSGQAAEIKFTPQVSGLDYKFNANDPTTGNIANLIKAIYKYAIGIVGILAAIVLMVGGVMWIIAGGNATQIGEAKAWIGASLTGLVLALTSYLILATISPDLVNLRITKIPGVAEMKAPSDGSCTRNLACIMTNEEECNKIAGSTFHKGEECPSCCAYGYSFSGASEIYNNYAHCDDTSKLTIKDCGNKDKNYTSFIVGGKCVDDSSLLGFTSYHCENAVGLVTTGSCTYSFKGKTSCGNNYTKKQCDDISGSFKLGEVCL